MSGVAYGRRQFALDQLLEKAARLYRLEGRYIVAMPVDKYDEAQLLRAKAIGLRNWHLPSDGLDNPSMFWATCNNDSAVSMLVSECPSFEVYDRRNDQFMTHPA